MDIEPNKFIVYKKCMSCRALKFLKIEIVNYLNFDFNFYLRSVDPAFLICSHIICAEHFSAESVTYLNRKIPHNAAKLSVS